MKGKSKRHLYGLMSLLSLLGFIGIFTENRIFLVFFTFLVDLEYFFIKTDEMLESNLNKSACNGFYCGMVTTAIVALAYFLFNKPDGNTALLYGITSGWSIAIAVHSLSIAYYSFRENWGLEHDKK